MIDNSDETYLEKAKDSVGMLGLKNVEVLSCSEAAYFTDPWKSDQRARTVILQTEECIDSAKLMSDECSYH